MAALVIVFICGLILLLYIFRISTYFIAIGKRSVQDGLDPVLAEIKVSLLIPFRNEAQNLPDLFRDTQAQQYPNNLFEVIFINDHSED